MVEIQKPVSHKGNMPRRETDLLTVATNAVVAWRKKESLVLKWTTVDEFDSKVDDYRDAYRTGATSKGDRRTVTQAFAVVNTEIDSSLKYVKGYITEKFGADNAVAHYEQFGIVKVRKRYMLPEDGDRRQEALEQMVSALRLNGLTTQKYGADYWDDLYIRFGQARGEASAIDSVISQQVADKSDCKETIRETLNALIHLIRANYPHTWREEMRQWGFQKEKY